MNVRNYYLARKAAIKWLESPCIYHIARDELYELDEEAFAFVRNCAGEGGCIPDDEFLRFCLEEDLLSERRETRGTAPLRQSPIPSLRYLELQITDRCNLKCRHCYIGDRKTGELDITVIRNILDEFEAMQGLRVLVTGGEPLLHSKFRGINEMLPSYAFRSVLITNGLLLSEDRIAELNIDEMQISIDGCEEAHDFMRGKGTYKKTIDALKASLDAGISVSVSTMVHCRNLDDFEELDVLFRTLGIRDWTVDVPCDAGYMKHNAGLVPPPEIAGKYLRYGFGEGLHGGGEGYVCGLHLMSVMADGRAAKCAFYADDSVGHVREGLEACWLRVEHMELSDIECDCDSIEMCRGGCRFRATLLGGPREKDRFRCAAFLPDPGDSDDG